MNSPTENTESDASTPIPRPPRVRKPKQRRSTSQRLWESPVKANEFVIPDSVSESRATSRNVSPIKEADPGSTNESPRSGGSDLASPSTTEVLPSPRNEPESGRNNIENRSFSPSSVGGVTPTPVHPVVSSPESEPVSARQGSTQGVVKTSSGRTIPVRPSRRAGSMKRTSMGANNMSPSNADDTWLLSADARTSSESNKKSFQDAAPPLTGTIQWETASFYTMEDEESDFTLVELGIARLGPAEGFARVQWSTFDMSALAGTHFEAVEPSWVEFQDGVTRVNVQVKILRARSSLDGPVELGLYIDQRSAVGAGVGKYLHTATLKVVNSNVFPHNALRNWVAGGNREAIAQVSPLALTWSFFKLCVAKPVARAGTIKIAAAHQYHSLVSVLNIFIMLFIVGTLTNTADETTSEREESVVIYGLLWIFPFVGCHVLSYCQQFWKTGGVLKKELQVLLLRKFLHYTDDSRNQVAIEALVMALIRDVTSAVADGFLSFIDLVFGCLFKIVYLVVAMVYLQTLSDTGMDPNSIVAVLLLPVFIGMFLVARQRGLFDLRQAQFLAENTGIKHVIKCVLNFPLIADFDRRTFMLEQYGDKIDDVRSATTRFDASVTNSKYFAPWLTTLLVGVFIIVGGIDVINERLDLPTFLSTIQLFRALGAEFEKAYGHCLAITTSYESIVQLTVFMNLPNDVPMRLGVTETRCRLGQELRDAERSRLERGASPPLPPTDTAVDRIPILMKNVTFSYNAPASYRSNFSPPAKKGNSLRKLVSSIVSPTSRADEKFEADEDESVQDAQAQKMIDGFLQGSVQGDPELLALKRASAKESAALRVQGAYRIYLARDKFLKALVADMGGLRKLSLEITQGQMVAIVGASAQGKATILRLLASQIFVPSVDSERGQNESLLFVPPHLRVIQIQETPMILGPEESIFDNLTYGIKKSPETDWDALELRARTIMIRLGLSERLMRKHFKEKNFLGTGGIRITRTDRQLISLGRAFVMNPEVIVAHKPTAVLGDHHTEKVMELFREFVEQRGVAMDEKEPMSRRRKRTLLFTAKNEKAADQAHVVYEVRDGQLALNRVTSFGRRFSGSLSRQGSMF